MPTTILDLMQHSITAPTDITVSAGSNRKLYFVSVDGDGTDASASSSVTVGGQSMVSLAREELSGADTSLAAWVLDEAGIQAMTGTTVSVTGDSDGFIWWSVQDSSQSTDTIAQITNQETPSALSLSREAGSLTFAIYAIDFSSGLVDSTNPVISTNFNSSGGTYTFGYGSQSEASTTVSDFTWESPAARDCSILLINVPSGGSTPTVTETFVADSADTPIVGDITANCSIHDKGTHALIGTVKSLTFSDGAFSITEDTGLSYSTEYLIVVVEPDGSHGRSFYATTQADPAL